MQEEESANVHENEFFGVYTKEVARDEAQKREDDEENVGFPKDRAEEEKVSDEVKRENWHAEVQPNSCA